MKLKKLLAAALAAALTLAGCGTTVLSVEETKELLALSQKTMATVESMAAEMTMEMDMSMGEETAETTTVAKILTQQNPLRMQMNLSATLEDGTEAQNMQMYAEEEDGKLRTYVTTRKRLYKAVCTCCLCGLHNLFMRCIQSSITDIIFDASLEQPGIL